MMMMMMSMVAMNEDFMQHFLCTREAGLVQIEAWWSVVFGIQLGLQQTINDQWSMTLSMKQWNTPSVMTQSSLWHLQMVCFIFIQFI